MHHLRRGTVKQYKFHEGGFALELAQGMSSIRIVSNHSTQLTRNFRLDPAHVTLWVCRWVVVYARSPHPMADNLSHWYGPNSFHPAKRSWLTMVEQYRTRNHQELAPRENLELGYLAPDCNHSKLMACRSGCLRDKASRPRGDKINALPVHGLN